jgi:hypothetical protein
MGGGSICCPDGGHSMIQEQGDDGDASGNQTQPMFRGMTRPQGGHRATSLKHDSAVGADLHLAPSTLTPRPRDPSADRASNELGADGAEPREAAGLAEGMLILNGRYRVEGFLDRGGMGEVWQVRHLHGDCIQVLKLINPAFVIDSGTLGRFLASVIRLDPADDRACRHRTVACAHKHEYGRAIPGTSPSASTRTSRRIPSPTCTGFKRTPSYPCRERAAWSAFRTTDHGPINKELEQTTGIAWQPGASSRTPTPWTTYWTPVTRVWLYS